MIEIPGNIVVLEFTQEELDRIERPDDLPEGASMWPLVIPDKYRAWDIRWILQDFQTQRWVVVLTEYPILIQRDVIQSDEGYYEILESVWCHSQPS